MSQIILKPVDHLSPFVFSGPCVCLPVSRADGSLLAIAPSSKGPPPWHLISHVSPAPAPRSGRTLHPSWTPTPLGPRFRFRSQQRPWFRPCIPHLRSMSGPLRYSTCPRAQLCVDLLYFHTVPVIVPPNPTFCEWRGRVRV